LFTLCILLRNCEFITLFSFKFSSDPELPRSGSELIFSGSGHKFLIQPSPDSDPQHWRLLLLSCPDCHAPCLIDFQEDTVHNILPQFKNSVYPRCLTLFIQGRFTLTSKAYFKNAWSVVRGERPGLRNVWDPEKFYFESGPILSVSLDLNLEER
jgi:hypothetical protein